jgi:hypothetical protein
MQTVRLFNIDLVTIRGKGDCKCPECEAKISPDDQTEEIYTILETIMNGENLDRIVLQCKKCGGQIQITGFQILA